MYKEGALIILFISRECLLSGWEPEIDSSRYGGNCSAEAALLWAKKLSDHRDNQYDADSAFYHTWGGRHWDAEG